MSPEKVNHNNHSRAFTPVQAAILIVCGVLVCVLAGSIAFILQPEEPVQQELNQLDHSLLPKNQTQPTHRVGRSTATPHQFHTRQPEITQTVDPLTQPQTCLPDHNEILIGEVIDVPDGQSIQVLVQGQVMLIAYAGIYVPTSSTAKNRELVSGHQVVMVKDISEEDSLGRLIRYVLVGDRFINFELVRMGYAQTVDSADQACADIFRMAEGEARAARLVLWQPTTIPTLTFLPTVGVDAADNIACDCSIRWTCADFSSQKKAQACYNACNDYSSTLDDDRDGLACEELP